MINPSPHPEFQLNVPEVDTPQEQRRVPVSVKLCGLGSIYVLVGLIADSRVAELLRSAAFVLMLLVWSLHVLEVGLLNSIESACYSVLAWVQKTRELHTLKQQELRDRRRSLLDPQPETR